MTFKVFRKEREENLKALQKNKAHTPEIEFFIFDESDRFILESPLLFDECVGKAPTVCLTATHG